jgi:hypothetical protein
MAGVDWKALMQEWNERVLASARSDNLPLEVKNAKWLGFPPASDAQIASVEERLGIPLPPSYRAFLKTTNGWHGLSHAIDRVWGTDEVTWFKNAHKDWIAAYTRPRPDGRRDEVPDEEYFAYETPMDFRPTHLRETLQVSEVGDAAVLLLNPQVIDTSGEWEAWFFANWNPGAHRFRSFRELIESEYHRLVNREWRQRVGIVGDLPDEYIGGPCSPKRRLRTRRRRQVVKVLDKPVDRWDFQELLALLRHEFWQVREQVVWGLAKLKDPRAIEPLLSVIDDDSNASCAAIHALKTLAPDRLRDPLLDLLRKRHFFGYFAAASVLAELDEIRAIPILVDMVKDTSPGEFHRSEIVGGVLTEFGASGLNALLDLLANENSTVRRRAARSLVYSKDPRTIQVLRQLLADDDPTVREDAALALKVLDAPRERSEAERGRS